MTPVTRTQGPLHFEDLEAHRFEDLIRQLAWRWRSWEVLEPTGARGNDGGVDIRGFERVVIGAPDAGALPNSSVTVRREWRIQCKRVKTLGPADMREIARELLRHDKVAPFGVVLAAPCDVTGDALKALREEVTKGGAEVCVPWTGRAVEDMLMSPANRDLLFCYFGVPFDPTEHAAVDAITAVQGELEHNLAVMKAWESFAGAAFEKTHYQRAFGLRAFATLPRSIRDQVADAQAAAGTVLEAISRRPGFDYGYPNARNHVFEIDIRRKIELAWHRTQIALAAIESYLKPSAPDP